MKPEEISEKAIYDAGKEEWRCKKCNSVIMSIKQVVSLHMKGTLMGFGETYTKEIPYCPKCEEEPSQNGGFDYYGSKTDPETKEMEIIRSMGQRS